MTTVMDIPAELGTYMLRGWVLTDTICTQCKKIPLLRSPSATRNPVPPFCVTCNPSGSSKTSLSNAKISRLQTASQTSASTSDTTSQSTAPTEVSSHHGSPEFIPVDTPESIRRRQQSDTAASEIGRRLLKGWAMLADECPGPDCFGVPLVRPPKTGGENDPRKECVICGTVYVDEEDATGPTVAQLIAVGRREPSVPHVALPSPPSISLTDTDFSGPRMSSQLAPKDLAAPIHFQTGIQQHRIHTSSSDHAIAALEATLQSLAERLGFFSSPPTLDVAIVGQIAEAMSKVSHALLSLKDLQQANIHL